MPTFAREWPTRVPFVRVRRTLGCCRGAASMRHPSAPSQPFAGNAVCTHGVAAVRSLAEKSLRLSPRSGPTGMMTDLFGRAWTGLSSRTSQAAFLRANGWHAARWRFRSIRSVPDHRKGADGLIPARIGVGRSLLSRRRRIHQRIQTSFPRRENDFSPSPTSAEAMPRACSDGVRCRFLTIERRTIPQIKKLVKSPVYVSFVIANKTLFYKALYYFCVYKKDDKQVAS